jgi:hypothetical protein
MSDAAQDALTDILKRHGVALIEDRRRCEACIRDTTLPKREVFALVEALKLGIPQSIAETNEYLNFTVGVTNPALMNHAARLVDETGLNDSIARQAVENWAHALKAAARPAAVPPPPDQPSESTARQSSPTLEADHFARRTTLVEPAPQVDKEPARVPEPDRAPSDAAASQPTANNAVRVIGAFFIAQAMLFVLAQGGSNLVQSLLLYLCACGCLLVGIMLRQRQGWIKRWAFALCAVLPLQALIVLVALESTTIPTQRNAIALASAAGGLLGLAAAVVLPFWKPKATGAVSREQTVAFAVAVVALGGLLHFTLGVRGFATAISQGYLFNPLVGWTWLQFLISCVLLWAVWNALSDEQAELKRGVVFGLCLTYSLAGAADIITLTNVGRLTPQYFASTALTVVTGLAVATWVVATRARRVTTMSVDARS